MPVVALLHAPQPTAVGHLIYGAILGRYPAYLPAPAPVLEAPAVVEQSPSVIQ